jgi:hypothetical protein
MEIGTDDLPKAPPEDEIAKKLSERLRGATFSPLEALLIKKLDNVDNEVSGFAST